MWQTARDRSSVQFTFIAVVAVVLSLLVASPSSATAAKVAHSRMRRPARIAVAPVVKRPATAAILNPEREMLIRLQDGQRTLEKQTADFNTATQRQISQLSSGIGDSRRETRQMLEATGKRIDSAQKVLKLIVALLVLLCGGLLYVARQLPRLGDKSFAWKGDITPEPDQEGIVSWRKGDQLDGQEAGSKRTSSP
jgi:tellurite resistance protein